MSITANPQINGVDVPTLFATLDAVREQNEIAAFRFRASNTWVRGTHSRSTYSGFFGDSAIKLSPRGDGRFGVENGFHRIWVARELGIQALPVRLR